ncbi:tryptophan--tRNA ligase [Halopenitus persicus]|uniref:Tryptophan--tRNA ligase n=1 Tax=Halopenitus persicus TaxID=1048396 RepID=A0A1H3KRG5_9EURY|nr:tryptophan--tRNA ligase [Halopenitus persicus]SDY54596.1 tryptophanyl-tRNA synthetase [Halopenitus persicus]
MTDDDHTPREVATAADALADADASAAGCGIVTDGGTDTAAGADDVELDPWGSATVDDYRKLFEEFGIEEFDDVLPDVPHPHYLMRRGVIFGHREYDAVAEAMANDEPFAALSGFMPTGDPHIGHKLVFDELIWHQRQGGDAFGLIADLEAHAARGLSWDEIDEHARSYVLSLIALGFDPEAGTVYRQSDNREVQDLAFELGSKANFSELQALYGFDGETNVSHMQSTITQMADILYPQLVDGPKPTVVPVGPDQDPHLRLSRDLSERMRYFKVTEAFASFELGDDERQLVRAAFDALAAAPDEDDADDAEADDADDAEATADNADDGDEPVRCEAAAEWLETYEPPPELTDARRSAIEKLRAAGKEPLRPRVRFLDRNATDDAFEDLIGRVEGEKRVFEGHVDAFDLTREAAETLAREVELDHDGFGFRQPSSIYHRFMSGLTGGKMSSSIPASHISLLDDPEEGAAKVNAATTGGRSTAEEQRELGGKPDECPVYELYAYLLADDDDDLARRVYEECAGGDRLCGGCKEQAAELMREFLADHQEKREEAAELLEDLDIDFESDRRGTGGEH